MKKPLNKGRSCGPFMKFDLKMKLTTLFLLTALLALHANDGYSQKTKITLNLDNTSVSKVLDEIESNTEFRFAYSNTQVDVNRKVSLNVRKALITEVLELLFAKTDVDYVLRDRQILLKSRTEQKMADPKEEASISQDPIRVTGKVTDENGVPIPGVTVLIKGTTKGVATDSDGGYTIIVPDPASVLVFMALGFTDHEVTVGNQATINITLKEAVSQLDEVVLNAGYYKVSKLLSTGNISQISAKTIEKQPITNPLASLQGRVAGVNIVQNSGVPGSTIDIQIRGRNSLRSEGNDPLYIIDGLPFSSETLGSDDISFGNFPISDNGTRTISPINSINPSDIESIEILKDADATAIYGSRGANGVILITTKKGKSGKTKVDINLYSGMSSVTRTMDLLKTDEYLEIRREGITNDGFGPFLENPAFNSFFPDVTLWDQNRYTDWQKEFIGGTAYITDIQTSISGGSANTQFFLSGGYHKETTVFPGDFDYKKASGHFKLNHQSANNRFKLSLSTSYISDNNNLGGSDLTFSALNLAPNAPALYDEQGNLNWEDNTFNNPIAVLEENYLAKTNNLIVNSVLDYELVEGLTLKTNLGFNSITLKESKARPSSFFNPAFNQGSELASFIVNNTSRQSWIIEPQIQWNLEFDKSKLSLLIGSTFQERTNDQSVLVGTGFSDNSLITNISAASSVEVRNSGIVNYNYSALFGRINYNWDDKYIINITGRRDGSSRFGPGKQFANFWALGGAWIFSKENILKDSNLLSLGKLRGSYGTTGSDQIGDYQFLNTYSIDNNYDGQRAGLAPTRLFNADFSWEINKKLEAGLELGFLENNIYLNIGYFRNRSSNQLIGLPLSAVTGFTSVQTNLGATVQNTGIEVELNTTNIQKENFSWKTDFNITIPKNKLIEFPGLEQSEAYNNRFVIGEPLNINKVYEFNGVDPDTGLYLFTDFNNDDEFDSNDRQLVRSLNPEYYGGLANSFTYKGLQLDFLFQFVKQIGRNYTSQTDFQLGNPGNVPRRHLDDAWREIGDIASIQKPSGGFSPDSFLGLIRYRNSSASYTDASFVRLKNISLSYNVSERWTRGFNIRIYMQGQNLLTFTDYFGLDPENQNISKLPPLKTISLGAQFTF